MITDVISVTEHTTIKQLLETLVTRGIGGVPIVASDNTLIGIISDGDIIRYLQPKARTVYDMFALVLVTERENLTNKVAYSMKRTVKTMMKKKEIFTVSPEDNLEEALQIFSKRHFKKIPVVNDENKIVGVVSRGDIIRSISTKLIDAIEE